MDNFVFEQKKVIVFVFFLLIAGVGLSWMEGEFPRLAGRYVYVDDSRKVAAAGKGKSIPAKEKTFVSINTACEEELCRIRGIGPVLARRIVEYRKKNGPFRNKEDVLKIKGIGPKKFEKMKDDINYNP